MLQVVSAAPIRPRAGAGAGGGPAHQGCRVAAAEFPDGEKTWSPRPHEVMDVAALPKALFWGNVSGLNALTTARNQHIPMYCGSCWAMATTSALSDRLKIAFGEGRREINLAPQVLINCNGGGTCHGGDPSLAYKYISEHGIPEETCQNYEAVDGECKPKGVCETCVPGDTPETFVPGVCSPIANFSHWFIAEYGKVNGGAGTDATGRKLRAADKIKAEIAARGPVSCGMHVSQEFVRYRGGIFKQFTPFSWLLDHEVSLLGWGEEGGEEFWIGRNSWGTWWGEQGLFRIAMHRHNLGIELECTWATPSLSPTASASHASVAAATPRWIGLESAGPGGKVSRAGHSLDVAQAASARAAPMFSVHPHVRRGTFHNYGEPCLRRQQRPAAVQRELAPRVEEVLGQYPASWDVRNISGVDFATLDKNQHIPMYCGSCWAQSVTSALSDRINMRRNNSFPKTVLAAQALVNCVSANETNGCRGGDPTAANSWMQENDVPDITCQAYQAKDLACDAMGICQDCTFKGVRMESVCSAVSTFPTARVASHGQIAGEVAMVAEIAARGPITCGMCVTEAFEAYAGGVFVDETGCTDQDHAISIAGYGVTPDGQKYWIGRNSWGTYWGEDGWFKLARGVNNMGIEESCDWAEPVVTW